MHMCTSASTSKNRSIYFNTIRMQITCHCIYLIILLTAVLVIVLPYAFLLYLSYITLIHAHSYLGVRGLKKALSKFDPEKGFAFSTYAYPWIKEFMRIALASSLPITLPRHVYRLLLKVKNIQQQMSLISLGRMPTDEETADEMGISIER